MARTKTILLLRHAHAAWAQPGIRDFDRPLDERGVEDAGVVGRAMAAEGLNPDLVLCSPAKRCVQTCDIITALLPDTCDIRHLPALYSKDHRYYVEQLAEQEAETALLIGHNPMMEDTAHALAHSAEDWPAHRLQKGFPTSGLAVLDMVQSFDRADFGGHLTRFLTPKRLKKGKHDGPS
ncbi:MAG: histidine phosphatase family protein [Alphaproteobacteria bacterium]|nr:histidine phosphatase family protein [Alphaproteobacteria bacterium]